jgi:hypothetical protein
MNINYDMTLIYPPFDWAGGDIGFSKRFNSFLPYALQFDLKIAHMCAKLQHQKLIAFIRDNQFKINL